MHTTAVFNRESALARVAHAESASVIVKMLREVRAACDDRLSGICDADLLGLMENLLGDFFRKEGRR